MEINDIISLCRNFLSSPDEYAILDTETTGLGKNDIIIQLAILDMYGKAILNTNVRSISKKRITRDASEVHGITSKHLSQAPYFTEIVGDIYDIAINKSLLIFNAEFDNRMLQQTCLFNNVPTFKIKALCIQKLYSIYLGEWSDYYNEYKLQKLPNASHNAFEDCQCVLRLIRQIASKNYLVIPKEEFKVFGIKLN